VPNQRRFDLAESYLRDAQRKFGEVGMDEVSPVPRSTSDEFLSSAAKSGKELSSIWRH